MAQISTGTAIVAGSVIVGMCAGVGAYLGLRQRAAPATAAGQAEISVASARLPSSAPHGASTNAGESIVEGPPTATGVSPAVASPGATDGVRREVLTQFEAARSNLVKRCWDPLAAKHPEPKTTTFTLHVLFDADGQQLGRSFLERGGPIRGGVAQCAGMTLPELKVDAPGARVTVEIPLTLP